MATDCHCPITPIGPTLASTCGFNGTFLFMTLLDNVLRSQCDITDPCGRVKPITVPDTEYDFIVVGGGSAGSVVASRLSEVPQWKVLLIEAGGDEPDGAQVPSMCRNYIGSDIDWRYYTQPEKNACLSAPNQRCYWPRGKVLGGTSVIHGMKYNRGNPSDYDKWEAMGNPGWKYDDVLPFFKKSEDNLEIENVDPKYHATGGLLPVSQFSYHPPLAYSMLKGAEELGFGIHDLNAANCTGFTIAQTTSKNGVRYSSARAFLRPARDRPNLHILLNTIVSKVLVHPSQKIAQGVEIIDSSGHSRKILVKKEVILSAGTIDSPKILLLSGVGPKEDLEKVNVKPIVDLPGVGRNLHNHVSFPINFFVNEKDTNTLNRDVELEYLLSRKGPMSSTGLADVAAKIVSKYAEHPDQPDIQFYFNGYVANCSKTGQVGELQSEGPRMVQILPACLHPRSRGYITLESNDPLAYPMIFANYLTEEHDVNVLLEGIKVAIALSKTKALQAHGMRLDETVLPACKEFSFGTDEYWKCAIKHITGPENHQAGTCKMGPKTDPTAVVDHKLRVHGVKRLRVIDASIMPKVISGNTNAPTIMIGEKGSHMIKRDWRHRDK